MDQKKQSIGRRFVAVALCLVLAASTFSPLAFAQSSEAVTVTESAMTQTQPDVTANSDGAVSTAAESASNPVETDAATSNAAAPIAEGTGLCVRFWGNGGYEYAYDGGTLPPNGYYDLFLNGEKQDPVLKSWVSVSYFTLNDEPIPEGAIQAVLYDSMGTSNLRNEYLGTEEGSAFWFAHKDDGGYKIRITCTPEGQEPQTITVTKLLQKSTGVNEWVVSNPSAITYADDGVFQFTRPWWSEGEVKTNAGQSPFPLAENFSLSGEVATYFTLVDEPWLRFLEGSTPLVAHLKPTAALDALPIGTELTGALTFTDQITGKEHTMKLTYTHKKLQKSAGWCQLQNDNRWLGDSSETVYGGTSGVLYLRAYDPNNYDVTEGLKILPLTQEDLDTSGLAEGVTATVMEDGQTVELRYSSSSRADESVSTLGFSADGSYKAANQWTGTFTLTMVTNYYRVAKIKGSEGTPTAFAGSWQVVPIMEDSSFAKTKEDVENSGIQLDYPQDKFYCIVAPVKYYDETTGKNEDVWAYVLFPLQTIYSNDRQLLKICYGDEVVGTETLTATADWAGYNIMLKNGTVIERMVEQKISFETGRSYWLVGTDTSNPWDNPSTPVVTGEPTITGEAKDNLQVIWGKDLSSFGIIYNEHQVPGQAVITIPTGPRPNDGTAPVGSVQIIVNFSKNATSGSYQLNDGSGSVKFKMVDDLEYALNNGSLNFDTLDVERTRFVGNEPFDLFFYGVYSDMQYKPCTFGSELVEKVEFESSDPTILQVTKNLTKATVKDRKNNSNDAFGARITPTGKTGTCDVIATITFATPDATGTKTVSIGYTFKMISTADVETKTATPETLQSVLDAVPISDVPTIIELEGGEYAMNLVLHQKNVILRSKDPENPAIFTGDPTDSKKYIIAVNPYNSSLVLDSIVVDGGNNRYGVGHTGGGISVTQVPPFFTMRNCTIRNCVIGVTGAVNHYDSIYLRDCTVQDCQVGVQGAGCFNTSFTKNVLAHLEEGIVRFCDFSDNDYDMAGTPVDSEKHPVAITESVPQNYWGMENGEVKTGPSVAVVNESRYVYVVNGVVKANLTDDQNAVVYSSPYYLDKTHTAMNVDLANTEMEGNTAILPLQQSEKSTDSMLLTADAFAALKAEGLAVSAPIMDSEGRKFASWSFGEITDASIETNLNISNKLSDKAQSTVNELPESEQAKVVQEVNLSHNGTLPGRATIRIKASEVPDGDVSNLFLYWVKEDGTIVPAEVVDVQYDADTNEYIITVDHCSEYIITSGELKNISIPTTMPTSTPATNPNHTPEPPSEPDSGATAAPAPGATATPAPGATAAPAPGATAAPAPSATATPSAAGTSSTDKNTSNSGNKQQQLFSAQQVIDAFASQPEDVTLQVSDSPFVSQRAFALLMERTEGALRLQGNGYAWVFDRANLKNTQLPGGVFDTTVTQQVDEDTLTRIHSYVGDSSVTALETGFSGTLPGTASLEITVDAAVFGNTRCGLFYLPEEGEPERIATVEVDENGLAKLPLEHCSIYYLVAEETISDKQDAEQTESNPESVSNELTESNSQPEAQAKKTTLPLIVGVAVLLGVAVVLVVIGRRRNAE